MKSPQVHRLARNDPLRGMKPAISREGAGPGRKVFREPLFYRVVIRQRDFRQAVQRERTFSEMGQARKLDGMLRKVDERATAFSSIEDRGKSSQGVI